MIVENKLCLLPPLPYPYPPPRYQGKKFLSYLFGLSPTFVGELHGAVLSTLPRCPKGCIDEYAEVRHGGYEGGV